MRDFKFEDDIINFSTLSLCYRDIFESIISDEEDKELRLVG